MLGKLLKHEWKSVTKVMLPACLVLVAITILGRIMMTTRGFDSPNQFVQVLASFALVLYVLCLMAVSLLCTVFLGYRFYKTTYTDEGYLLHTLPVSTHEIILSKAITGAAWSLITSLLLMGSVAVLVLGSVPESEISSLMRDISYGINTYIGPKFTAWCILLVFTMIVSSFYSLLWLFAGISFGQLLPKHKVLGAFIGLALGYFVMYIVSLITMLAGGLMNKAMLMVENSSSFEPVIDYLETTYLMSFGLTAVFTVLFYLFTNYMMKKKLNLD